MFCFLVLNISLPRPIARRCWMATHRGREGWERQREGKEESKGRDGERERRWRGGRGEKKGEKRKMMQQSL